jgi:putative DNA-invertase from lambdoid prophage Rac
VKFALYARVSTHEQTNQNQIDRLVDYAKVRGWDYEIIEEEESTRKTRPKKAELLQRLRSREFVGVCIWKLDRWARSSTELVLEIQELHDAGLQFVSISDGIDLSSATGRLQFQILSAFAEFERNLISERTKEGLARARRQGKTLGRPRKRAYSSSF